MKKNILVKLSLVSIFSFSLTFGSFLGSDKTYAYSQSIESGQVSLTEASATIDHITLSTSSLYVETSKSSKVTAKAYYSDGNVKDITSSSTATWSSSDSAIATVSKGTITGKSTGKTNVTVTFEGITSTAEVNVIKKLSKLTANYSSLTLPAATSKPIILTATYSDGTTEEVQNIAPATPANKSIADTANGFINTYAPGSTSISYAYGSKSVRISLIVKKELQILTITPDFAFIETGKAASLKAKATYTNGDTEDVTNYVDWNFSDNGKDNITVTKGTVKAINKVDTPVTISAVYGSANNIATANVTIINAVKSLVTDKDSSVILGKGQTLKVALTATYKKLTSGSEDVTNKVQFNSSNTSVATVDAEGIKAIGTGSTTITYTYGSATATINVTVKPEIKYIEANASEIFAEAKGISKIKLTAYYADGDSSDITKYATYSMDDTSIATVSKGTLTAGASEGTTTLSVQYGTETIKIPVKVLASSEIVQSLDTNKILVLDNGESVNPVITAIFPGDEWVTVSKYSIWETSSSKVATFDPSTGTIKAVGVGTCNITINFCSKNTTIKVKVVKP